MMSATAPLPWQEKQWSKWRRSVASGRRPHAVLLSGAAGIGKHQFAEAVIAGLLCERSEDASNCGSCHACEVLAAGSHPDLRILRPPPEKRQIPVDDVRAAIDVFQRSPMIGDTKVCLIEPAEALGIASCNALLKTLEEPPGNGVIILVSASPSALLPTIRSRCQQLKFATPARDHALSWLQSSLAAEHADTDRALNEAGGRPLLAAYYLREGVLALREEWDADWSRVIDGEMAVPVVAEKWAKQDFLQLLDWLCARLAACIRAQAGSGDLPENWRSIAALGARRLHAIHAELQALNWQSRSFANANKRLQIEAHLFRLLEKQSILTP